jgi:hypothetical protein
MSEEIGLNPAERELEEALQSLAPAAARIDPIAAAYEAGRRSMRRQLQLWRAAAAAVVFAGVGSWLVPFAHREITNEPLVAQQSPSFAQPLAAQSVLMLSAAVREHGIAGLPATRLPVVSSTRPSDLL